MIILKAPFEIEKMRDSGKVAAEAMKKAVFAVKPGVTTRMIEQAAVDVFQKYGAKPSFQGYNGFPGAICVSVNEQVVHGIPGTLVLKEGDIVSIDLGAFLHGYHSDMARTVAVGEIKKEAQQLIDVTKESFYKGMAQAVVGNRIVDIGSAIQTYVESYGMSAVTDLVGHGIGQHLHEGPDVPNYKTAFKGPVIKAGMTIAIEPMINLGTSAVVFGKDGWTVTTRDGKLSAHYENTVAITENGPEILTLCEVC